MDGSTLKKKKDGSQFGDSLITQIKKQNNKELLLFKFDSENKFNSSINLLTKSGECG